MTQTEVLVRNHAAANGWTINEAEIAEVADLYDLLAEGMSELRAQLSEGDPPPIAFEPR
jgi:hypothetical protein